MTKLADAERADRELFNGQVSVEVETLVAEIKSTVEQFHLKKLRGGQYWIFHALLADRLRAVAKDYSRRSGVEE